MGPQRSGVLGTLSAAVTVFPAEYQTEPPLNFNSRRHIPGGEMSTKDRGFASMDKAKQRAIASKGGKAVQVQGTAHRWTVEEASKAGKKGGTISSARRYGTKK
jgi:general stress protein YciG